MSDNQSNTSAVSIYGQEGLDDFPVLKAFQQYIDAEQNKARKRMLMLCVFFGFLMTVMITVFLLVLKDVSGKNQSLNDRLIEYVMKSNDRHNVIVQQPAPAPANDAALKAMTDTLVELQKQMSDQREKAAAAQLAAAQAAARTEVPAEPSKAQAALQRKIDSEALRLEKESARLKAEKEKLAAEKEKLRQQEIELHRRRLYPEYYEKLEGGAAAVDAAPAAPAAQAAKMPTRASKPAKPLPQAKAPGGAISYFGAYDDDGDDDSKDDDIDALLDSLPPAEAEAPILAQPQVRHPAEKPRAEKPKTDAAPKADATPKADAVPKAPTTPLAADHFNVPLEINGETSDWLIPAQQ